MAAVLLGFASTAPAQTAADPNEGTRLTLDSLSGTFSLSWWGQPGRTYFLQRSENLFSWEYVPVLIESGMGEVIEWGFPSTAERAFFRLRSSDQPTTDAFTADFDGDKVSNWDELTNLTDPLHSADTDDDDLPDDWEIAHFGNLARNGEEEAPGGYSVAWKFSLDLDPTTDDTDGDGISDFADNFPKDDRRSESIPVKYYGAIDLTTDLPDFPAVSRMALNDSNQVAFYTGHASSTRVAVWKNGAILSDHTVLASGLGLQFFPGGINANGEVVGGSVAEGEENSRYPVACRFWNGAFTQFSDDFSDEFGVPHSVSIDWLSESGKVLGVAGGYHSTVTRSFLGEPGSLILMDLSSFPPAEGSAPFDGSAISPDGICGGFGFISNQSYGACLINGSALEILPTVSGQPEWTYPNAVNDQRQAVGESDVYDSAGYPLGFFYTPATGPDPATTKSFHDLLPEKYRKQLRSAIPYLITNADPVTNQPTITFGAEVLKGGSEGNWVPAVFQWEKSAAGEVTIREVQTPAGETPILAAQNSRGDYAGPAKPLNAAPGAPAKPSLIPRVEFYPVDVDKGFDPSMEGDVSHDGSKDEDKKPRETWTSVSRKEGGKFITNRNIKLVFNSAAAAKACKVVVRDAATAPITVAPELPQDQETTLTIEGKPVGNHAAQDAWVEVWDTNAKSLLNVLNVRVLPERTIQYRV